MAEQESVLRIKIDSQNAKRNANDLNRELASIEKNGDFASNSMDSMSVAARNLAGSLAGIVTVGAAINKMDAYTNMSNRLKLVTNSQEELNTAMNDTFVIAQNSRQQWESVLIVYQRFADNAKELNLTMEHTASLTDTVAKAVAISGSTAESAQAAIIQFGQALASGVLRGEEFNSVMEQTPALAKAIANGLGVNIGQLRAMANEGKLTADVLVKALDKAKVSVDELFSRTDVTISQSITLLSNEVTKFTGEAGKATGVASGLASAITTLSQNLESIANVAVLGGVALLTKAIVTKTVAVQASIAAAMQKRAADAAEIQSQIQLSALEVQRTRQVAALALTELNLARQELNSATTRQARAAATMRLTQAEVALAIATKQVSTATAADTAIQNANTAARSRAAAALALVGGPVGALVIGVTALSAAYMYFSNKTAEANAKLEEQSRVAEKTKEELLALKGVQRDVAKDDLAAAFADQNDKLNKLNLSFNGFIRTVKNANAGNKELQEISDQVHKGLMSQADAIERLNKLKLLTPEQKAQGLDLINSYEEARIKAQQNADAQKILGTEVNLAGNAASNAVGKVNNNTNAMHDNADAANRAAQAQSDFIKSLQKSAKQTQITNNLIAKGWDVDRAKLAAQAFIENNNKISGNDMLIIDKKLAADKKLKASEEALTKTVRNNSSARSSSRSNESNSAARLAEQQYNDRERIHYEYASREGQMIKDLESEISRLRKAGLSEYIPLAQARFDADSKLTKMKFEYDLVEFRLNEEQKLRYSSNIRKQEILSDASLTKEQQKLKLDSLDLEFKHELANIELAKEQRIFQAQQAFMAETDMIRKKYELERQEIALNQSLSKSEREALNQASYRNQSIEENASREKVWSEYQYRFGERESPYQQDIDLLKAAREQMLITEEEYQQQRLGLQLSYGAKYADSFLGTMMGLVDSNSSAYRAMAVAQKGFALYSVMMDNQVALAKAWSSAAFPYNLPAVGAVLMNSGILQAAVQALNPTGFKTGGYTGNVGVNDVAGVVHGREYVLNAEATKRMGISTLNAVNAGADLNAVRQAKANAMHNNVNVQPQNISVNNILDPAIVGDYMSTPSGTKTVMNLIKNNRTAIKATIG